MHATATTTSAARVDMGRRSEAARRDDTDGSDVRGRCDSTPVQVPRSADRCLSRSPSLTLAPAPAVRRKGQQQTLREDRCVSVSRAVAAGRASAA
mmetsp:Transcript_10514/g.36681  ORF Transcript_10514/g.36681 Transcript_10514/m.36681 type:complete len:95 (+) Transcript_10514:1237-1521(+)